MTPTAAMAPAAEPCAEARRKSVSVCIPARNEATTIAGVVAVASTLREAGAVDEIVVVDDGSTDDTAAIARRLGATVVANPSRSGKGQALARAFDAARGELLVFLDGDVKNYSPEFVTRLLAPLADSTVQLVKPDYRRPLDGRPDEGGRVTELLARPLLERFFPSLAAIGQPLAGECAVRRAALDAVTPAPGYGFEIGLLIDLYLSCGRDAIVEVDCGERIHRNRPLYELRTHACDVLDAVLARVNPTKGVHT